MELPTKGNRHIVRARNRTAIGQPGLELAWMAKLQGWPYSITIVPPAARKREREAGRDWRNL